MPFEEQVLKLLGDLNQRQEVFQADINTVKTEVGELRLDVDKVKTEVGEIRLDVDKIKTEVGELKLEVDEVKNDVKELKEENHMIKRAVLDPDQMIESVRTEQKTIYGMLGEHEVSIRMLKEKIG